MENVGFYQSFEFDDSRLEAESSQHHTEEEPYSQRSCSCLTVCPVIERNMTNLLKKFDLFLNRSFKKFGHLIADYTGYFIIVPILMAFLLGTGLQRALYEADPEYLFAPINGPAKDNRNLVEHYFRTNHSNDFDPSRATRGGNFVRFIITAKDGGSLLKQEIWEEINELDHLVQNQSIIYDSESFRFKDLCARWDDKCFENKILKLYDLMPEILNGSLYLNYPVMINPYNFEVFTVSVFFGGVKVNESEGIVEDVKALTIYYWLMSDSERDTNRAELWEQAILDTFAAKNFHTISAARFTSNTLRDELEINTRSVIPYIFITLAIMVFFSSITLFMSDWVRGKPYLGVLGILSVIFSCMSAFGMLMYCGVPFIGINLAAPFLMLGIGIDDTFVMLAAWRRTRLQDPLRQRLGEAYSEAAVSITITSITDMVSFYIGVITPFPSVQIFCLYTGTAVMMTYLFQITFFGACMAVAGRQENHQQHSICCIRVKSKSETIQDENLGCCYKLWCSGGISETDPWNPRDNKEHKIMIFFKDVLANLLNKYIIKAVVLLVFLVYLCGAIYGCINLKEGLEKRRLSRLDSYSIEFYDMEDEYFREYPYRIQVVLAGDLNYSDPNTRKEIINLHNVIESQPYMADNLYTESWIRGWYEFLDNNMEFLDIDMTDEADFIKNLREIYLMGDDNVYRLDVDFNEDFTRILASRFIVQAYNIPDSNSDKDMMQGLREIAFNSPLNVTVFHPYFVFFDQFVLVRSVSIQTICIAAVVMMFVSLIFIPNPYCSLWVAFSIISIEIGVIGYMTLWGVNLDSISMINLIMCIGFSVDFSAHISYAYLTSKDQTTAGRVRECLYTLGLPILQGAISTIIGVVVLVFAPSYIFITFFKTVFLVIVFGAMHGLFLLPVLLSILGPGDEIIIEKVKPIENKTNDYALSERPVTNFETKVSPTSTPGSDRLDKDMGLGTSGEESNESSLSKATGAPKAEALAIGGFSNAGFIGDSPQKVDGSGEVDNAEGFKNNGRKSISKKCIKENLI